MSAFSESDHHQFSDSVPFSSRSFVVGGLSIQVEYHFFSDQGLRNDQRPGGNLFANMDTNVALALHSCSLSSVPHAMSLNIDMKITPSFELVMDRPFFVMISWTLLMSCNVVNPGKYTTRISSALRQLCPKFCIVVNL